MLSIFAAQKFGGKGKSEKPKERRNWKVSNGPHWNFRLFQSPISNALKNKKPGFQAFLFLVEAGGIELPI
jgi:chloramphenicol O-acetyltransferase